MTEQTAADLRAAADVLERDGWTQFTNQDPGTGCRCVAGAAAFAVSDGRTSLPGRLEVHGEYERWSACAQSIRAAVGNHSIVAYNDEPGRTAAEVLAALRAAADAEAGQ